MSKNESRKAAASVFPEEYLSGMTPQELIVKWMDAIYSKAKYALSLYYDADNDGMDVAAVKETFEDVKKFIDRISPVLEDLTIKELTGVEDVFIASFGLISSEVYVIRRFKNLWTRMPKWSAKEMYDDCAEDDRMARILGLLEN